MKAYQLGEFEELVMLTVAVMYDEAYGLAIKKTMEARLGRSVSMGGLHAALRRLEAKGFVHSRLGEATRVRGGKRKRYFVVTTYGFRALSHVRETRQQLWNDIPRPAFHPFSFS